MKRKAPVVVDSDVECIDLVHSSSPENYKKETRSSFESTVSQLSLTDKQSLFPREQESVTFHESFEKDQEDQEMELLGKASQDLKISVNENQDPLSDDSFHDEEEETLDSDEENSVSKKAPIGKVNGKSSHLRPSLSLLSSGKKSLGMRRPLSVIKPGSLPQKKEFSFKPVMRVAPTSDLLKQPFKAPSFLNGKPLIAGGMKSGVNLGMRRSSLFPKGPLHDPEEEGAIVLYTPKVVYSATQQQLTVFKKEDQPEVEVHVVIDPLLASVLRPHQIEGVRFLYECVTGLKVPDAYGCIMADEMGLGKTLQCITLLWTLLRQSPTPGKSTIEKAIITCPSSLVKNWANELKKWLGENRIRPYACDGKGTKEQTIKDLENFVAAKGRGITNTVLIISYETLRIYTPILKKTEIGLMMADEGHRLKNAESLTYQSLNSLNAKRRIILSGTPIQNDLTEYFSLLSFAIPDVLGSGGDFRKKFEIPILRGRDADASDKERAMGEERLSELLLTANKFIIRRTAELLTKYLPVKYEYVVFCKLTEYQKKAYLEISTNQDFTSVTTPLQVITILKKLCNHPFLLKSESELSGLIDLPGGDPRVPEPELSGKMILLDSMLIRLRRETTDKIVLISNYTQTLDYIENLCRIRKYGTCRLDGTMSIKKRQKLVDRFNDPMGNDFVFLLSSKAGGCGINLIGANRLILFDPDWNPASDAQALARVWRDGQKKMCFIYRFISTGTIEEKIFQRQAHKQSLSSCVVDAEEDVERHFSLDALRSLFKLNENTTCDTHDTFKCKRCKDGKQVIRPPEGTINTGATAADTSTWSHFSSIELHKTYDSILKEEATKPGASVSFVFQNKSHDQVVVKTK